MNLCTYTLPTAPPVETEWAYLASLAQEEYVPSIGGEGGWCVRFVHFGQHALVYVRTGR